MKQPLTHGLVLGKFAPLHKGHEYLIETALREMDRVTVMIYHCSFYPIPLSIRANWIRTLYPQVEVLEAWDGPESCGDTPEIKKENEDYILSFLGDRKITHFYCSEFYGEHVSAALHAVDRRVDEARATVPISATEIRKNPFRCRKFLSDTVYRDLIVKVVFVGAMSTGKSTIAEALAKRHHTTFAPEYGREYWTEHQVNRRITLEAFDEIALGHLEREEQAILAADRYCFIDTNAITTYLHVFSRLPWSRDAAPDPDREQQRPPLRSLFPVRGRHSLRRHLGSQRRSEAACVSSADHRRSGSAPDSVYSIERLSGDTDGTG